MCSFTGESFFFCITDSNSLRYLAEKSFQSNFTAHSIDDLTINNIGFDDNVASIYYPKELQLKKTTEALNKCSYSDIMIKTEHGSFRTDVYKRDGFAFHIVHHTI